MATFAALLGTLNSIGFFDFVLPWLLFFAVVLGILDKSNVISDKKNINSIIAASIAFFIINYTPVGGIAATYSTLFGVGGMIIAALIVFVLFAAILGISAKDIPNKITDGKGNTLFLIIFALLAYGIYNTSTGNSLGINLAVGLSSETWTLLLVLLFILGVIKFAQDGNGDGAPAAKAEN